MATPKADAPTIEEPSLGEETLRVLFKKKVRFFKEKLHFSDEKAREEAAHSIQLLRDFDAAEQASGVHQ
jgi:hypothetical protein